MIQWRCIWMRTGAFWNGDNICAHKLILWAWEIRRKKWRWVMTDIHHRLMRTNSGVVFVCNVTLKGRPVQICGWCVVTRVHGQTQPHLSGHILRVLKESLQRHDLVVLGLNKSCPMMSTANTDRVGVSFHGYYCRLLHGTGTASGTSNHSGSKPANQRRVWTLSTLP